MSKTLTLSEAQTLLPVLSALMRRARESAGRAGTLDGEMQELSQRIFLSGGLHVDVASASKRRAERDKAVEEARSTLEEIDQIGAQVTDLSEGKLEITSTLEGRAVLLGWTVGESEIRRWREVADDAAVEREIDSRFTRGERPN